MVIHEKKMIHRFFVLLMALLYVFRDIKPDNILVQKSEGKIILKICDFGLARNAAVDMTTRIGFVIFDFLCYFFFRTLHFMVCGFDKELFLLFKAPEIIFCIERYDMRVDIWSMGVLFYLIIFGFFLFCFACEVLFFYSEYPYTGHTYKEFEKYDLIIRVDLFINFILIFVLFVSYLIVRKLLHFSLPKVPPKAGMMKGSVCPMWAWELLQVRICYICAFFLLLL
jgi:serine/threonine protein kinase